MDYDQFRSYSRSFFKLLVNTSAKTRPPTHRLVIQFIAQCSNREVQMTLFRHKPTKKDGEIDWDEATDWMCDSKKLVQEHFVKLRTKSILNR
jgi:hypothetical protein